MKRNSPFLYRYRNIVGVLWSLLNSKGLSQSFFRCCFGKITMLLWESYERDIIDTPRTASQLIENCKSCELTHTHFIYRFQVCSSPLNSCVLNRQTHCVQCVATGWLSWHAVLPTGHYQTTFWSHISRGPISMLLSTLAGWATFRCVCVSVCVCVCLCSHSVKGTW